jgi:hypothetical protein
MITLRGNLDLVETARGTRSAIARALASDRQGVRRAHDRRDGRVRVNQNTGGTVRWDAQPRSPNSSGSREFGKKISLSKYDQTISNSADVLEVALVMLCF